MSEKQYCDKTKMDEGEKIADGAINVCLRGTAKEFNYTRRIFLPLLPEDGRADGEGNWLCSKGRVVNSIFAFPARTTVLPLLSTAAGSKKKKERPRAFMSPASLATILRGVTRSIYSTRSGEMQ